MKPITLKRNVTVRAIVTPRLKEEAVQQLQNALQQVDAQIQQVDFQGKRAVNEVERGAIKPLGPEAQQQINSIRSQMEAKKSEFLQQKNQFLQQLNQVTAWEMDQEIVQGQVESDFEVSIGDNLVERMNLEVVLQDGIIVEIRGTP
ncbi:YlqD family protein [Candidatus Cyanaurora vandensis]|uniref:YlqD family protein n=1 Tax=Candidatus Cyanaurora vandensis TaxID=2714958 RepID=UPI00257D483B|nr:YlqD family protein [Candidatus Cyanaurora vandensis]